MAEFRPCRGRAALIWLSAVFLGGLGSRFHADSAYGAPQSARPKIGLVLAGGGALGFAHVGVLRVLDENRIPIDYVAGTSMGAIVGAACASGVPLDEMEQVLTSTDWDALFSDNAARSDLPYRLKVGRDREPLGDGKLGIKDGQIVSPAGFIQGQRVLPLLQRLYGKVITPVDFDTLPVPFRAITADIETGEAVVIGQGDLATAVRASMSVPGVFAPVEIGGRLLVDGGIADNLPVDVTRNMGADILVVVELFADLKKKDDLGSPFTIAGQIVSILLAQNSAVQRSHMRAADILIAPNLKGYSSTDFAKGAELMRLGKEAALAVLPRLKGLSVSEAEYRQYRERRGGAAGVRMPLLAFVRVEHVPPSLKAVVEETLSAKAGEPFDRDKVEDDLRRINNLGYFSQVRYVVVEEGGQTGLVISAKEKSWYGSFARVGMALEDNFNGDTSYTLAAAYRVDGLNEAGGHAETQVQLGKTLGSRTFLYQPLSAGSPYFLTPEFEIGRRSLYIRNGSDLVAEYFRIERNFSLGLGRSFDKYGECSAGPRFGSGDLRRHVGDPSLGSGSFDVGEVYAKCVYDQLDDPDFPRTGQFAQVYFVGSKEGLGADADFEQLNTQIVVPWTEERNTFSVAVRAANTFGDLPAARSYAMGGFFDIPGYPDSSILAADYFAARVSFYRRLTEAGSAFLGLALFGGGAFEYAKFWNDDPRLPSNDSIFSSSLFIGADTPVVPIYLGYGLADEGNRAIYFALGRINARN